MLEAYYSRACSLVQWDLPVPWYYRLFCHIGAWAESEGWTSPIQGWQRSVRFGFCPKPNQTESFSVELNWTEGVENRTKNNRLTVSRPIGLPSRAGPEFRAEILVTGREVGLPDHLWPTLDLMNHYKWLSAHLQVHIPEFPFIIMRKLAKSRIYHSHAKLIVNRRSTDSRLNHLWLKPTRTQSQTPQTEPKLSVQINSRTDYRFISVDCCQPCTYK